METVTQKRFSFGEFELDVVRRSLLRDGEQVALNSRAFDLLLELVSRPGQVLSKEDLLERVWAGQFVEEGNLTVHISALRKILGEKKDENRFIATVPGRGYSFVADLTKPGNSDSVVVSESYTRIVVEEEYGDEPNSRKLQELAGDQSIILWVKQHRSRTVLIAIALVGFIWLGGNLLHSFLIRKNATAFQKIGFRQLTASGNVENAALSHDGKSFVYSVPEGESQSLWLGHVDGSEPIQIRPAAPGAYSDLEFSSDNSKLYYTLWNGTDTDLYEMPLFGGTPEKIRENFRLFTFSPNASQVAYFKRIEENKLALVISAINGENEKKICDLPNDVSSTWGAPAWSPDGKTIVFAGFINYDNSRLYSTSLDDGVIKPLSDKPWRRIEALKWLKDASGVIAVGLETNSLSPQIWQIDYPHGTVSRVTNDLSNYAFVSSLANDDSLLAIEGISQSNIWIAPTGNLKEAKQITFGSIGRKDGSYGLACTPDGRLIYTVDTHDGTTLWIMNGDGSGQKQLIPNGGINSYPSLTADGRTLIFQSNRSGHFAIWRSDLDGGNMRQLSGDQTAAQPTVSPDGSWIVYTSEVDSEGQLWKMPTNGGSPVQLTNVTSGWANFSPDGRELACEFGASGDKKIAILSAENGAVLRSFDYPKRGNPRLGVHWTSDGKAITYRDWTNGIWRQDVSGGEPKRLAGLPEEKLFAFGWSADGKSLAYTRGSTTRDAVLITEAK